MNTLAGGRWTREILKLKKKSLYEYKWFGLACARGIIGLNPLDCIRQAKLMYPEITTEAQLDEQLELMGETIQKSFHKTFGKGKSIN